MSTLASATPWSYSTFSQTAPGRLPLTPSTFPRALLTSTQNAQANEYHRGAPRGGSVLLIAAIQRSLIGEYLLIAYN
jgi:hypothetical protein